MSEAAKIVETEPAKSRWLSRLLPYIVMAVALALTCFAFVTVREQAIARDRARFDQAVNSHVVDVQDRMKACTNILRGVAARITSGRMPISRSAFHNYVEGLDLENQYPGIQGVGYAKRIRTGEEAHLSDGVQRVLGREPRTFADYLGSSSFA